MIRRPVLGLIGAVLLVGCSDPPRRVELVSLVVADVVDDPALGPRFDAPLGLHGLRDGDWALPESEAVWALGDTARAWLTLTGHDLDLRVVASTRPELVERDQRLGLLLNGVLLWQGRLSTAWQVDTLEVAIPDAVVRHGANRFDLVTTLQQDGPTPRAVYLRSIEIAGWLDAAQVETWNTWTRHGPLPESARQVRLPASDTRPRPLPPDQPDLLVVVLDALRADHVSSYGYARETTPNLDRLAADGVRFARFFAEAPYTRNSVATLLSGRSWRDHGVVGGEDSLAPGVVTLAEILSEAGYATFAVSDNANVAISAGSDQGFDTFVQTWSDPRSERPPGESWWYPELANVLFEEGLAAGLPDDRPVFAYLHLMPPHDPYFPGEEHDVFGPEGYDGSVTGVHGDILALERGGLAPGSADHARLVALYDGHVRRGDALLRRALDAWRATGRSRPLLTVVSSDHGEAFGEHGRYGHNNSAHDAMIHVPLVLHPRSLVNGLDAVDEHLRSMSDVLPLVLRTLDIGLPPGTTWPSRTLRLLADPKAPLDAVFVRCGPPRYGVRTADRLSLLTGWGGQSHFDLVDDPEARHDLRPFAPRQWWDAVGALRAFVADQAEGQSGDLTEEDRERLRALGYM